MIKEKLYDFEREQKLLLESIVLVSSYRLPGSYIIREKEAPEEVFYPCLVNTRECRIAFDTV